MAALDDELGLPEYEAGTIVGAPTAPAAVSALGEDEEAGTPTDYGGGQDQYAGPPAAALLADPRVRARINSPRVPEFVRQRLAELMAQQQQKAQTPDYQAMMNDPAAMQRELSGGQELQYPSEPKEKPKEEEGYGAAFVRGFLRAGEDAKATAALVKGEKPKTSKVPEAEFEKPIEMGDFASPSVLTKKLIYGLSKSAPEMAGMIAGSAAGTAAGGAIGSAVPVVGTAVGGAVGGVLGGAAGMGTVAAVQTIGTAYGYELEKIGENPTPEKLDQAWDNALIEAGKSGGVSAASIALFMAGKPLGSMLKNMLSKPVVDAAGAAVKAEAGVPLQVGVQAVGQPLIPMAGQAAANVAEGKPVGEGVLESAPGSIANVAVDAFGRAIHRGLGGRRAEVTPGVSDEQKLALDAAAGRTTPAGPGGTPLGPEPTPARPTPPPFEAPPAPPGTGPGGMPLEEGPAGPGGAGMPPRPPGGGPGGTPVSPEPPLGVPVHPVGPTPAGVGGTPLGPEPTPAPPPVPPRPAGGPGGMPLEPEPVPVRPTEVPPEPPPPPPPPGAGPGGMPLGPEPTPGPPRPTGPTPPGIGGTPLGPEPRPAPPPTPEPPPRRPQPPGPGGTPLPEEAAGLTIEHDHLDPSRVVAKRGEDVVGKGATPEQATQDAALRQGAPYRDEGAGFTTERGSTYEIHDDGTTTRNKSYHPEHGAEDVGPKPRSAKTIYVDSQADAANLSGAGVSGAFGHRLVLNPDGTATLAWKARPDAKWGTHPNNRDIPFTTEPAVGKHPVEMWGKATDVPGAAEAYSGQHAGNKIVEMRGRAEAEQAKPAEARTNEQLVSVGDEVQWTSLGQDQFATPRKVTRFLSDTHVQVEGSNTGIPISDLTVVRKAGAAAEHMPGLSQTEIAEANAAARQQREKAPPAEAAKPEPAARGRDAASETPSGETVAKPVYDQPTAPTTRAVSPSYGDQLKTNIAELDKRNAPDLAYRDLLSTASKGKRKGQTWRDRAIELSTAREKAAEVKAKGEARKAKVASGTMSEEQAQAQLDAKEAAAAKRTKSGAYTSPGEAAEAQAPRPAVKTQSDLQAEVAADAAKARKKGLVSEATRRMAEAPTPEEPFHVPDNLNTVRKAQRIIQHILNGMKIADAVKAFGAKAKGTVGRPRNVESLSSFIREELRTTKTGAADAARDTEMAKAAAKLRKLGPEPVPGEMSPERRAILDELNERLKLSEGVRANRAKLEDALRQAEAIERGEPIPTREVQDVPRSPMAQIVEYMALRPEVNEPILRAAEGRRGSKFSSILDAIENNRVIQRLIPQYSELARVLRRILPDVDVVRSDDISYAGYNPNTGKIEVNAAGLRGAGDRLGAATAMLHEGIHVATDSYVTRLYRTPEELLTPRELAHKTALEAIRAELQRIGERASEYDRDALGLAQRLYEGDAPHELATYILTQPEIMGILAGTKASVELKTALNNVGLGLSRSASIWDGFKRIVRSILGLSERSDSVLDHVLRPLTDIVETGGRYRREEVLRARREIQVTNNEVLGGSAQTREVTSMRRLRETAARTAKDIADRGIIKTAMRGAFQSATTTAIRDFIRNDVPSAVSHLEYLRQITHASEQERVRKVTTHGPNGEAREEANIDKARRLHQELKTGPDAPEVNKLMTEVTQAEMSMIDPRRNAHLTTDAQLRQQEAFQARFDALDPRAQQTYREVNEYHNEIYRAEREAKVKNLVDIAFGDRSEADKQAIREQMRTKQGVLDVLNNPDATPVSKVLGRDWTNKKDLVRLIAESQEGGFVDGDYFPSRRHGEYVVSAGEHNKPGYLVQMFETQSSAQAFRDQLIQSGRNDVSQVFVKSRSRPRDLVSVAALSTLDKAMERAGLSGDAAEVMRDMYAGIMIQHGTRLAERTMRREGIAGASVDQARNILGDFLAYTSRIGHLMHGADAARTLYQSEKEVRALHQAGSGASEQRVANAQLGVEELRNRMSPGDGDRSADWMGTGTRRLTTLTVLNTLLRPAHYFMQLAGTHAASTSLIAARHGYLGSVGAVNRAYAQLAGTAGGAFKTNAMAAIRQELRAANWDLADMYRRRLSRANSGIAPDHADLLIDRLNQAGLINHTWIREIQRLAGPQGFGGDRFNFVSRFLDVSSAGEHAIDSMMRVGTAKAAFQLEYAKNGGHLNDALDYAMQMAERSQPDYTMHNKARIATVHGSLGRLAPLTTQFRQFGLHMYGVQGNLLAEGVRGARGSAERAEAYKAIAYLQASHALIWSGVGTSVFGSLPMMAGLGLFDMLNPNDPTNRAHTNREMETASRNWVRNITGSKTAADIFAHGVPMAFGLNVSRSLQFTNMLSPPELNSFNKPDVLSFLAQAITGASGDTAAGMVEGMSRIMGGDISKETIAKLLPRIARDPLEAIVWGEQGLKTHKGDLTIVPSEKFSTFDLLAKAAGFIPEASSTPRDARATVNLRELTHRDITGSIIDRLVKAAPNERKAVLAEITRYNASVDPVDRITGQQIQSRLREQAKINAMPGQFGMRVPRREYGKIAEITAFSR